MPTPDPNIPRRVQRLENEIERLQAELRALKGRGQRRRDDRKLRLAKTVEYLGSYPSTGNTFRIEFLDSHYTAAQGDQTATHDGRGSEVFAQLVTGSGYVAEGAIVSAFFQRGLGGASKGEWWIVDGLNSEMCIGRANGAFTARSGTTPGKGIVHIYQHDGGDPGTLIDTATDQDPVYNMWNAAISDNAWMQITKDRFGDWYISATDC